MGILKRAILWLAVSALCFAQSSLFLIKPGEVGLIGYRFGDGEYSVSNFGYVAEPGVYLGDPFAEVSKVRIGFIQPTTAQYLQAAEWADDMRDAWFKAEGPRNPRTKQELEDMVWLVASYIDKRIESIGMPASTVTAIKYFEMEKGSSRYDYPLAFYSYMDRSVTFNWDYVQEANRDGDPLMSIITHELSHGALNVFTGEQLCQLLTLTVLRDMQFAGVPGAGFAFWDEMRDWFLWAARFRVEFNHGWLPLDLRDSNVVAAELGKMEGQVFENGYPKTWLTHSCPCALRVYDTFGGIVPALLGNPYYLNYTSLENLPTANFGIWAIEQAYNVRAHGLHVMPARALHDLGVPFSILRLIFGPTYWHIEWTLIHGEDEALAATIKSVTGDTEIWRYGEIKEQMRNNPGYYAYVWMDYLYGPLMVAANQIAAGRDIDYYVLTKDLFEMDLFELMMVFFYGWGIKEANMPLDRVGPVIQSFLRLKPDPIVVLKDVPNTPQWGSLYGQAWFATNFHYERAQKPPIKFFPLGPIVALLALLVERPVRRGYRKFHDFCEGFYGALGYDITKV